MQRRFIDYLLVSLKGIAMGAADVVPGVSGGTIAFISGIYEELINSIDNINSNLFRTWKRDGFKAAWYSFNGSFLLALFSGIGVSILSLAKLLKWLLNNKPVLLWAFFFGLVLASILYVAKQITQWSSIHVICIAASSILSYYITLVEPFTSPDNPIYLLFCGFIAIIAMILPGVSGAFILLILGAYETALDTINNFLDGLAKGNFEILKDALINFSLLAIGAIIGLKVFSKALNWMFKHKKNLTLALLTGFMIGSLNKIWPWKEVLKTRINSHGETVTLIDKSVSPSSYAGDSQVLIALALMCLGFTIIVSLEFFGKNNTKD